MRPRQGYYLEPVVNDKLTTYQVIPERLVSRQSLRQGQEGAAPSLAAISPQELEEAEFYRWMNPPYLDPETQSDIQTQFEESSEISLSG